MSTNRSEESTTIIMSQVGNFDLGKIEEKSEEDSERLYFNTTLKHEHEQEQESNQDRPESSHKKSYENI